MISGNDTSYFSSGAGSDTITDSDHLGSIVYRSANGTTGCLSAGLRQAGTTGDDDICGLGGVDPVYGRGGKFNSAIERIALGPDAMVSQKRWATKPATGGRDAANDRTHQLWRTAA